MENTTGNHNPQYDLRAVDLIPIYGLNNYEKRTESNEELGVTNRMLF